MKALASYLSALDYSCPNANCKHFSLFRPRQCNETDTSHLRADTRPHVKYDYGYLFFQKNGESDLHSYHITNLTLRIALS